MTETYWTSLRLLLILVYKEKFGGGRKGSKAENINLSESRRPEGVECVSVWAEDSGMSYGQTSWYCGRPFTPPLLSSLYIVDVTEDYK